MIGRTNARSSMMTVPAFSYSGSFQVINDSNKNWRIKFLTSGTLRFHRLNGASQGIDVFLVGGGGAGCTNGASYPCGQGGGGGYTKTVKNLVVSANVDYPIVVGAGGIAATGKSSTADGADGGTSSAFSASAEGGEGGNHGNSAKGGKGGSGGGSSHGNGGTGDNGGSDGSNGVERKTYSTHLYGIGQQTTTREFGEASGQLYAGGGGGSNGGSGGAGGGGDGGNNTASGTTDKGKDGTANTGGGGGGGNYYQSSGGSGIVIIRNRRG